MWYRGSVTVSADRAKADYASADIEVCPGVISKFYRLFPPGCAGLVRLQVYYQTRQIFPTTPGGSYLGDDSEILSDATVFLDEPEYVLQLRGWSPGSVHQHIVYCEFYIARPIVLVPVPLERPELLGL